MSEPLAAGTRIVKVKSEPRDGHQDGDAATIHSFAGTMPDDAPVGPGVHCYFVVWDDMPGVPVFIAGHRVAPA